MEEMNDWFNNYDWCYECHEYGGDYYVDENGELVNPCDDCPHKNVWSDDYD